MDNIVKRIQDLIENNDVEGAIKFLIEVSDGKNETIKGKVIIQSKRLKTIRQSYVDGFISFDHAQRAELEISNAILEYCNLLVQKKEVNTENRNKQSSVKKWTKSVLFVLFIVLSGIITCNYWNSSSYKKDYIDSQNQVNIDTEKTNNINDNFWESLSPEWKEVIIASSNIESKSNSISHEELNKIFGITEINLKGYEIKNLNPLGNKKFKKLTHIFNANNLNSLKGVEGCESLFYLDISNSQVTSLNELKYLYSLSLLNLENTEITNQEILELQKTNNHVEIKN
jgi:hypothetical protein